MPRKIVATRPKPKPAPPPVPKKIPDADLHRRIDRLERELERLIMTAADLAQAVSALTEAVGKLPVPAPALITQVELDEAVAGVKAATDAITAKTPA